MRILLIEDDLSAVVRRLPRGCTAWAACGASRAIAGRAVRACRRTFTTKSRGLRTSTGLVRTYEMRSRPPLLTSRSRPSSSVGLNRRATARAGPRQRRVWALSAGRARRTVVVAREKQLGEDIRWHAGVHAALDRQGLGRLTVAHLPHPLPHLHTPLVLDRLPSISAAHICERRRECRRQAATDRFGRRAFSTWHPARHIDHGCHRSCEDREHERHGRQGSRHISGPGPSNRLFFGPSA